MFTHSLGMLIVMIVYLAVVIVIGVFYSKKNNSDHEFYLGGRKLGPFVTAMSAEASDMSSWLLMGLPGVAYLTGCAEAVWTAIGLVIGTYLNWLLVAKRLSVYTNKTSSITIPEFFSNRYSPNGKTLLAISALIIIIFFVPYTAAGFAACGKLFSTLFGIDYLWAMLASAFVIVTYTSLGGFLAASTTDLIQSIIMTLALITVIVFGIESAGGFEAISSNANALDGYLSLFKSHDPATLTSSPYSWLTIISLQAWGLGYFGMPHVLLRFMAIEDENKLKLSRRIATSWVVIAMGAAIFIGIIGNAMSKTGVIDKLVGSSEAETILIQTAMVLANNGILPLILGGLILAGILACTMSTADSQLLAAASSFSRNLLHGCAGKKVAPPKGMLVARLTVISIAIIAALLAQDPNSSVFRVVSFAWAGFGASFGPTMLLALFWKRSNKFGAISGMLAGAAMVFIWKFCIAPLGGVFSIYELLPAFLFGLIVNIIVSLATKPPSEDIVQTFNDVKNSMKA